MKLVARLVVVLIGLAAIVIGIAQFRRGVKELRGPDSDPRIKQIRADVDTAVGEANRNSANAQPLFQQLLGDVDTLGLAKVREQQRDAARKISDTFGRAAEQFRLAATHLDDWAALNPDEKTMAYLTTKKRGYTLAAQAHDVNQEILRLVLDDSIRTLDELLPKLQEAAARRDALQKSSTEAEAQANDMAKAK